MKLNIKSVPATIMGVLALGALFLGVFVSQHLLIKKKIDVTQFHGTYLQNPRPINSFALTGIDEKIFDNSKLQGRWSLIFFGFTNCGYLCPTTLAELNKMHQILEKKAIKKLPQVVMISIDPKRDTLDKLGHYVTSFQPDFYGARGEEESIKLMAREMGIAYTKVVSNSATPEDYEMEHSGAIMLFNPKGELTAFFTTPHHGELLAKDYLLLVS